MVAFRASRLVWLATSVDEANHLSDLLGSVGQSFHRGIGAIGLVDRAHSDLGRLANLRPISSIERDISSAAAATVCTLVEACLDAEATLAAC